MMWEPSHEIEEADQTEDTDQTEDDGLCRKQELEAHRNLSTLCLGGKHIELFGGCFQVSPRCIHLSFLDHRHHLDTG